MASQDLLPQPTPFRLFGALSAYQLTLAVKSGVELELFTHIADGANTAKEIARGCQEQGGLITMEDLAKWKPLEEEPLKVNYKGIKTYQVY